MFDRHKRKNLEKRRRETLSGIRGERLAFEVMMQRAQVAGDTPNDTFVGAVRARINEIEQKATQETDIDELTHLIVEAERQGQLRAYICPAAEIRDVGILSIDEIEEWGVPREVISNLRDSLGKKLEAATANPDAARGALRAIFEEYDSWVSYTDIYYEKMKHFTFWLFVGATVLLLMAFLAFHLSATFVGGFLFASATGSCVSIMTKMPVFEVGPSGKLEAYGRQILTRIGSGVIASLIGCGLLGWGLLPIAIHGQTFADVLNACTAQQPASCTALDTLILLAVPMLFGFSERALTSFERQVLR